MENLELYYKILTRFDENLRDDNNDNSNIKGDVLKVSEERIFETMRILMNDGLISYLDGTRSQLNEQTYMLCIDKLRITTRGTMFLKNLKKSEVYRKTHLLNYIGRYDSECIVKKEDGGYSLVVNNPDILAHGTRYLFNEEGFIMPTHICAVVENFNECNEMDLEEALEDLRQDAKEDINQKLSLRMYNELKAFSGTYNNVYFDGGDYHVLNDKDEVVYTVEI